MPRTLTPLETGLATYLGRQRASATIIDGLQEGLHPTA
jgi:hypothetical protein